MPVVARGNKIVEKRTGKVVGASTSHAKAVKAARVRNAVRHGFKPSRKRRGSRNG